MRLPWRKQERPATREEVITQTQKAFEEFLGVMRVLLGDAENYLEMAFVCPVTFEKFYVRIQRAEKLTPHDARVVAEQERDRLAAENAELRAQLANMRESSNREVLI